MIINNKEYKNDNIDGIFLSVEIGLQITGYDEERGQIIWEKGGKEGKEGKEGKDVNVFEILNNNDKDMMRI